MKPAFLMLLLLHGVQTLAAAEKSSNSSLDLAIYFDADRSRHFASARAIEMGLKTAFAEVGNSIQGRRISFHLLDHRGNAARSKLNLDRAKSDPRMLFVMAGLHSPPLITHRDYINEQKILTLVPWAAGGPITRYPGSENWIFRLSIDDTKAGYRISNFATQKHSCAKPHLVLERTSWGESNRKTMSMAIEDSIGFPADVTWFNWGASKETARIKLRHIAEGSSDCMLFVGNAIDGTTFMDAMLTLPTAARLPVYSHWGITGGAFVKRLPRQALQQLELSFIQSCFSFVSSPATEFSHSVFKRAQKLFPELVREQDLAAPAGFVHAYDLGRLVIAALSQFELGDDMAWNRNQLRMSLENIEHPIQGLLKLYRRPFSEPADNNPDSHEALDLDDYCMAEFGPEGEIVLLPDVEG